MLYSKSYKTISEQPTCTYIKHPDGYPLDIFETHSNVEFSNQSMLLAKIRHFFRMIQLLSHCDR